MTNSADPDQLASSLVIFLGPGVGGLWGGGGGCWLKEFALNFCLCLFLYLSINFCAVQYGWSFFCIYLFHN